MKNLEILLVLFFIQNISFAQSNQFFPSEKATWEDGIIGIAGVPLPYYPVLCGDTLINGKTYSKMYTIFLDMDGNEIQRDYRGGTRLSLDQVFWFEKMATEEEVLYDFSLETGDVFTFMSFNNPVFLTVVSNELINTFDGITRRKIEFDTGEIWIEGIGSDRGVIQRGNGPAPDNTPVALCYKYDGQLIWEFSNAGNENCEFSFVEECDFSTSNESLDKELSFDFECYPNPISNNSLIKIEGFKKLESPFLSIYNLQGQLVEKIVGINEEKFIFSRKNLNAGVYVFELTDGKTTFAVRKKIVLTR